MNVSYEMTAGRFLVKTLSDPNDLKSAYALRYKVFQVEVVGNTITEGEDHDEFDLASDHLAIFDTSTNKMIATCRLNCSLFSNQFYTAREFNCTQLLSRPETKLEIGRVCVQENYRKGIIIILLWRAIAKYMVKTKSKIRFGCGSVMTENPDEAILLYRYLSDQGKVRHNMDITPQETYQSAEFNRYLKAPYSLSEQDRFHAESLLPPLCRSYFDIGCYIPGPPAFDHDFKCIDFLTVLESKDLDSRLRQKMFGEQTL